MENRSEPRIDHQVRFFVHVHECDEDPDIVGTSLSCDAVDFSVHGLQLRTEYELITGTLLNITIGIGQPFAMYLLRGEVRWVRPNADEIFMGVLLRDADATDFAAWVENFDEIFLADQAAAED